MKYFKPSKWQKKKPFDLLIEDFKKESRDQDLRDKDFLEFDRIFVDAWHTCCLYPDEVSSDKIELFEQLIRSGIEQQWGRCNFDFDRNQKKAFVTSFDGRAMELVSGNIISDDGLVLSPKPPPLKKPTDPILLGQIENACNDWLQWLENTK